MTDYRCLEIEQVVYIHDQIINHTIGTEGVRDFSLLHSAIERCKATFGGQDLYPTAIDKASALVHSLIMNHPFVDGNKRTGLAMMTRFLNANGYKLTATQGEIVEFCIAIDNEGLSLEDIKSWIETHTESS